MIKSIKRCDDFESSIQSYERKFDYLQAENDYLHSEIRDVKIKSLELVKETKMEEENTSVKEAEKSEDIGSIQEELHHVRSKLNGLCFNVLKNIKSLDEENLLKLDGEKFSKITIIENDLSTSFITRQELYVLKENLKKMQEKISIHEANKYNFEELKSVTQNQLKSQQLLLKQFSDDEITARHLIVDLQSRSNENYLLTKTVRNLKVGVFVSNSLPTS